MVCAHFRGAVSNTLPRLNRDLDRSGRSSLRFNNDLHSILDIVERDIYHMNDHLIQQLGGRHTSCNMGCSTDAAHF